MIRTEEEAYRLWCPMSRGYQRSETQCIASECMMWRWGESEIEERVIHPARLVDGRWYEPIIEPFQRENRRGYCGLAERPEA